MNKNFFFLSFIFGAIFFPLNAFAPISCVEGEITTVYESCNSTYYLRAQNCWSCPTNATCAGGTATFSCNSGWYKTVLVCAQCPTGTTSPAGSTDISACVCVSGYYGPGGSSGCTECPINTASCSGTSFSCNVGFYKRADGTACDQCPANSTTAGTGSTSISSCTCNAGYYGNPGNSIACVSCVSGTGNSNATSSQGTTSINGCYLPASYTGTDITGDYGYSSVCGYTG